MAVNKEDIDMVGVTVEEARDELKWSAVTTPEECTYNVIIIVH